MTRSAQRPDRFPGHEYPQTIPEPDEIASGDPAPWLPLPLEQRRGLDLAKVVERLRHGGRHLEDTVIPGDPDEMVLDDDVEHHGALRRSAVLVALFEEDGETHVVLTRRSMRLRSHRGEIAFPGGQSDPGEVPLVTALRETYEEVGIEPASITPIGWLSPIVTLASDSAIWPVVGLLESRPEMTIDPIEVDRAFSVSLAELLGDDVYIQERWRREPRRRGSDDEGFFPISFFKVPGDLIWGATARVLTELLCVVTDVEWPEANRVWA